MTQTDRAGAPLVPHFSSVVYRAAQAVNAVPLSLPYGAAGDIAHMQPNVSFVVRGRSWLKTDGFEAWIEPGMLVTSPPGPCSMIAEKDTVAYTIPLQDGDLQGRFAVQPTVVMLDRLRRKEWHERLDALTHADAAANRELTRALTVVLDQVAGRDQTHYRDLLDAFYRIASSALAEPASLRSLGESFGYSPNHFSDIVRLCTGRSVHQWKIGFRMDAARRLLHVPHVAIGEIARAVGLDAPYFVRRFRARYSMAPSQWRAVAFGPSTVEETVQRLERPNQ